MDQMEQEEALSLLLSTVCTEYQGKVRETVGQTGVLAAISDVVVHCWDEKQRLRAVQEILGEDSEDIWEDRTKKDDEIFVGDGVYRKILVDIFHVDKHLKDVRSHKTFIMKTFKRFKTSFPDVSLKQIEKHDNSKFR